MRLGFALLYLAACGRVGFDRGLDAATNADDDASQLRCSTDDFAVGVSTQWQGWTDNAAAPVNATIVNGQLQIVLVPNAVSHGGIALAAPVDFTDGNATIEAVSVTAAMNAQAYLSVWSVDGQNTYYLMFNNGDLRFRHTFMGADDDTVTPYDSIQHRYWRISHDAKQGVVNYSTSAIGTGGWSVHRSIPATDLTQMRMDVAAGTFLGGSPSPGADTFDNFTLCVQ